MRVAHFLHGYLHIIDIDDGDTGVATGIGRTQIGQEAVIGLVARQVVLLRNRAPVLHQASAEGCHLRKYHLAGNAVVIQFLQAYRGVVFTAPGGDNAVRVGEEIPQFLIAGGQRLLHGVLLELAAAFLTRLIGKLINGLLVKESPHALHHFASVAQPPVVGGLVILVWYIAFIALRQGAGVAVRTDQ